MSFYRYNRGVSIRLVKAEITRFLERADPEVLCISGKWGVGKTYGWNYFLKEAKDAGKIKLTRYAYVSLFGVKKIDDLRYAIYEATKPVEKIGEEWTLGALEPKNLRDTLGSSVRWLLTQAGQNPVVQSYIGTALAEKLLFHSVGEQIICIDDLERAGNGLDVIEVFGLISMLKEQRKCKVVLLLNEEEIADGQKEVFHKQLEKVVDTHLQFDPTPQEAADIAFPDADATGNKKLLHDFCVTLGITNIRVLKKIERICARLEGILQTDYSELFYQAFHSATLFGWEKYQKDGEPPPFEFLTDMGRLHGMLRNNNQIPDTDRKWSELMAKYKFFSADDFDLAIHKTVQSGIFDEEALLKAAEKQSKVANKAQQEQDIHDAWTAYHGSFDDNEKEVMDKIFSASMENIGVLHPSNLNSTVKLLKEFGRNTEATELITKYVTERRDEKDLFDGRQSLFDDGERDEELAQAFDAARSRFVDDRNPADVLEDMIIKHGWNPEDTELISKLSVEDFYRIFKAEKGDRMHRIVRAARGLNNRTADDTETIAERAAKALVQIGQENRLNARRVKMHGVQLPEPIPAVVESVDTTETLPQ